jgi:hypothetical protein
VIACPASIVGEFGVAAPAVSAVSTVTVTFAQAICGPAELESVIWNEYA